MLNVVGSSDPNSRLFVHVSDAASRQDTDWTLTDRSITSTTRLTARLQLRSRRIKYLTPANVTEYGYNAFHSFTVKGPWFRLSVESNPTSWTELMPRDVGHVELAEVLQNLLIPDPYSCGWKARSRCAKSVHVVQVSDCASSFICCSHA